jgi:hypothetical protein
MNTPFDQTFRQRAKPTLLAATNEIKRILAGARPGTASSDHNTLMEMVPVPRWVIDELMKAIKHTSE